MGFRTRSTAPRCSSASTVATIVVRSMRTRLPSSCWERHCVSAARTVSSIASLGWRSPSRANAGAAQEPRRAGVPAAELTVVATTILVNAKLVPRVGVRPLLVAGLTLIPANPPAWIDITAQDSERSRTSYRELLGWEIRVEESMNYGLVQPDAERLPRGIGQASADSPHPVGVVVSFAVDDLDATLERSEALGAQPSCLRGSCQEWGGWRSSKTPTATASAFGRPEP